MSNKYLSLILFYISRNFYKHQKLNIKKLKWRCILPTV